MCYIIIYNRIIFVCVLRACPTYCALCYIIIHNILFVILLYISKPWLFELQKQMNLFFLLLKKKLNTVSNIQVLDSIDNVVPHTES